ncbi:hypothetical protein [Flavobacterium anhuiense]|uniref:hypothetical protein n=1 Tax=Flavobacterium anhuiense TaxID=459526 RepID=UPI0034D9847F
MEKVNKENFRIYLNDVYQSKITFYEEFTEFVSFFEIDCFSEACKYKLSIEVSDDNIKFGAVTKEPSIDFSLYDFIFETNKQAEEFVEQINKLGWPKQFE